jgi:hypothetical protein
MKIQRFTIQTENFGEIPILRPVPSEVRQGDTVLIDPWGELAPVRDHAPHLARLVPVVTGEEWSDALHGHARPLMLKIGPAPAALLKLTDVRECLTKTQCVMYDPKRCQPGKKLPECWWPAEVEEAARKAAQIITLAWAEGRYVVVVAGAEFSLGSGRGSVSRRYS